MKTPLYWRQWLKLDRRKLSKDDAELFIEGSDLGRALSHQPPRFYIEVFKLYEHFLTDDELEHAHEFLRAAVRLESRVLASLKVLKRQRPVLA